MERFGGLESMLRPELPRMIHEGVSAIWREIIDQFSALLLCEARANPDMLQVTRVVEQAEKQRADCAPLAVLVPSKPGNDAIAISLVLDLEHYAFAGLVTA